MIRLIMAASGSPLVDYVTMLMIGNRPRILGWLRIYYVDHLLSHLIVLAPAKIVEASTVESSMVELTRVGARLLLLRPSPRR